MSGRHLLSMATLHPSHAVVRERTPRARVADERAQVGKARLAFILAAPVATPAVHFHARADADMQLKERALSATITKNIKIPRFRPSDRLMDFLKGL